MRKTIKVCVQKLFPNSKFTMASKQPGNIMRSNIPCYKACIKHCLNQKCICYDRLIDGTKLCTGTDHFIQSFTFQKQWILTCTSRNVLYLHRQCNEWNVGYNCDGIQEVMMNNNRQYFIALQLDPN